MFPIRDHNPSDQTPFVTYALIAINVLVFLLMLPLQADDYQLAVFYQDWALIPRHTTQGGEFHGLFTSMFLHAGFMHLAGNMLFLWIFGDNLEDELGHVGFLFFYLASGLAASFTQLLSAPLSLVPVVGASGAIAGVMGGYLLLFPKAKVDILFIIVIFFKIFPVPAWVMLGLWFALQFFQGVTSDATSGGVAYWAHAGGFIAGFLLILPVWIRRGGTTYWNKTEGHPPHPDAQYALSKTSIPTIRRRK